MDKKVSVITPTFNRAQFLTDLMNNMLRQTYENWELIIVDDGSDDNTEQVMDRATNRDNRIKFYKRDKGPKGAAKCRNIGIKKAEGDYLIFLDSDDLLASFSLEQRQRYMEKNSELDFAVFYGLKFHEEPGDSNVLVNKEINSNKALEAFLDRNYPWHTSAPIWRKRSLVQNDLYWDENLSIFQDVDFHIRALLMDLNFNINEKSLPDYFWRIPKKDNVSGYKGFPSKFDSCLYFLSKLANLLRENDKLNNQTEPYINRFYFSTARIMAMESELKKAFRLWWSGFQKKNIRQGKYLRGNILLFIFYLLYLVFGDSNRKFKNVVRTLYYNIIPSSYDRDKEVLIFDGEIKT